MVSIGVADQTCAPGIAASAAHRFDERRGVGLAHCQRVAANQAAKSATHAQRKQKRFGQCLGLVGADTDPIAHRRQLPYRIHGTGIQHRMTAYVAGVMVEKRRIAALDQICPGRQPGAREALGQHRPPAAHGERGIGARIQPHGQSKTGKGCIGGHDQIGAGIGKGAVKIEYDATHGPPVTIREAKESPARLARGNATARRCQTTGAQMPVNVVILAAGQGTRMNSDLPKVLHPLAGAPLMVHAMRAGLSLLPERLVVVTGADGERVARAALDYWPEAIIAHQAEQNGTGHAVLAAADALQGAAGDALILYGDTPFVQPETLERMQAARVDADIVVLGFESRPEERYGRLVTQGDDLLEIVEHADADAATRALTLHNSGVVMADAATMLRLLHQVQPANAQGEIYLTDIVALGRSNGLRAVVVRCNEDETMGVNTRAHLARAEAQFQASARAALMEDGVTLKSPEQVFLAFDTVIGRDALIEGPCVLGPGVTIESGAHVLPFCHLTGCHISRGASVGPFARLRPGAELAEHAHVGNFVEVKNALLGEGVKVGHLTYLGDTEVGANTNIGAGTITANYDGVFKHRTVIGRDAFIGSNTVLVAPVTVGDEAMTASGSVVNHDVPAGAMAIARARQAVKEGFARRFIVKLRAQKAARKD